MKDRYYLYVWRADENGTYAYCKPYTHIADVKKVVEGLQKEDFWAVDWSVWDRKLHHYVKFD